MNRNSDQAAARSWAEETYFEIYTVAAEEADAFQPHDEDQLLPEAFIGALANTAVTAFLIGYAGEFGKGLWKKTVELRTARGSLRDAEADTVIDHLAECPAALDGSTQLLAVGRDEVIRALQDAGVGRKAAERIADRIVALIIKPAS
jgi:hypothetical protein